MARSKGSQSTGDGKESTAISGKPRRKTSNSTGHDCTICRKSNMTLSGLKIHLLTHSGEKPFLCTECDKRFTCSSNLKKHKRIHTRDYIYECPVCGKTCSDPSNMKKHMTVHSDEKAYTCPSCGKSYSYAQSLRQHMDDVHVANGERRRKSKKKGHFPCPECGKVFGYYWRCSLHQARIHAVEKPFKCPECGKAFARETILNKHIQTHEKPFPCTVCERRFSFRDQLRKHMRTHTGEKPYSCEQCLRSFTQRGSLTEHMRTHTGEKPFACKNCGQKFSSSSSLKRHERRVNACLSRNPTEEIPLTDTAHRRVIYISTQPVMVGLGSSTTPQPVTTDLDDGPGYSVMFSQIQQDYGNGSIAFYPSALPNNGPITMVQTNLSPSMPMDNACFAVPSDYQPNGRITMVSNSIEHSVAMGNYQPLGRQSIAMDIKDMESQPPLLRTISILPTEEARSSIQHDPTHPHVTLTTDGLKPFISVKDASNSSVNHLPRSSNYLYVENTDYYTKRLTQVGPPFTYHPTDVQPFVQRDALIVASTNSQPPPEYPRIAAAADDVKLLSGMNGINAIIPHMLPSNGTTLVTV